jgi:hypothetical protein
MHTPAYMRTLACTPAHGLQQSHWQQCKNTATSGPINELCVVQLRCQRTQLLRQYIPWRAYFLAFGCLLRIRFKMLGEGLSINIWVAQCFFNCCLRLSQMMRNLLVLAWWRIVLQIKLSN